MKEFLGYMLFLTGIIILVIGIKHNNELIGFIGIGELAVYQIIMWNRNEKEGK